MDNAELLSVVGVVAILLGVVVANNLVALRARARARAASRPAAGTWIGKHVHFEGHVIGEVIAQDDANVILRKGLDILAIPRGQVRAEGLDLGVKQFDFTQALAAGAAWKGKQAGP